MKNINISNLKGDLYTVQLLINNKKINISKRNDSKVYFKELNYNFNDTIEITIKNEVYERTSMWILYSIVYWIASLAGSGDTLYEGLPIMRVLQLKTNENLYIKCNDFKAVEPFEVMGDTFVEVNNYKTTKKSYFRWLCSIIIPFEILLISISIFLIFIFRELIILLILILSAFVAIQIFMIKTIRLVRKYL